jgi:hypothetical protein
MAMKITKTQLKQIIKEEIIKKLSEAPPGASQHGNDLANALQKHIQKDTIERNQLVNLAHQALVHLQAAEAAIRFNDRAEINDIASSPSPWHIELTKQYKILLKDLGIPLPTSAEPEPRAAKPRRVAEHKGKK